MNPGVPWAATRGSTAALLRDPWFCLPHARASWHRDNTPWSPEVTLACLNPEIARHTSQSYWLNFSQPDLPLGVTDKRNIHRMKEPFFFFDVTGSLNCSLPPSVSIGSQKILSLTFMWKKEGKKEKEMFLLIHGLYSSLQFTENSISHS